MGRQPGVRRGQRGRRVLQRRVQPLHHVHADLDRTLRPDPFDHLEVALRVRRQQRPLRRLLHTGDRRLHERVRQRVGFDHHRPRLVLDRLGGPRRQAPHLVPLARRGVVPHQFRRQRGLVHGAVRGQRQQEVPPQLLVHVQPVDPRRPVQQPQQQLEVALRRRARREEAGPGQLVLRRRLRQPQLLQRDRRQHPAALLAPVGRRVVRDRGQRLRVHHLQHADVALAACVGQHQRDEVARRHQPVPRQVPQRRPAQRPRQRIRHVPQPHPQGLQRALVEAHLAVGEVLVVDEHQVGPLLPGQLRHHRRGPRHVRLGLRVAHQRDVLQPVQADRDPVGAKLLALLDHRQLGHPAARVVRHHRRQHVHAGRLQPRPRPLGHVPPGDLPEHRQQVVQRGVPVRVGLEVAPRALEERVPPHVRHQLLEHRRALGVRDAVEVELRVLQVTDVGRDRVRGGQLVGPVRPRLAAVGEGHPRLVEAGRLHLREGAHEVREGLLQPQVVPPLHGDEVAEPHVGHLVQDRVAAALVRGPRHLAAEDVLLAEGHHPRVLHRAQVVLGHEGLVVLPEGVRVVEVLVEEVEALLGDQEDVVRVEVLRQPLAAHRAQRDRQVPARVGVRHVVVRARHHARDVRGDRRGLGEPPRPALAGLLRAVAPDLPALRRGHLEAVGRLQVGLLEVRVHPPGVGRLVLRVEVDLAVLRVHEAVHALARPAVRAVRVHHENVLGGQPGQGDPRPVEDGGRVQCAPVECDGVHRRGDEVREGGRARGRGPEADRGNRAEGPGAFGRFGLVHGGTQVEDHLVPVDGQQLGPLAGLVTGQILSGHVHSFVRDRDT